LSFFLPRKHLINHFEVVYKYSILLWKTEFSSYPLALIMPLKGNRFIIIMLIWWNELCLCGFIFLASETNWNIYLKCNKSISSMLYDNLTAHFLNSFSRAGWFHETLKSTREIIISVNHSSCCCIKWTNRNNLLVGVKNMINCEIMGFICASLNRELKEGSETTTHIIWRQTSRIGLINCRRLKHMFGYSFFTRI
jgi:hypothetical protein